MASISIRVVITAEATTVVRARTGPVEVLLEDRVVATEIAGILEIGADPGPHP